MDDKSELTPGALRKLKRRIANEELAKQTKFWSHPRSAEQLDYKKPVNKQAVLDLIGKLDWDASFDYKSERTRD
jgi:hypothetical protein